MLTKLTGCRTSTLLYISPSKTCDLHGRAIFGPQRHNLNKLGRGPLDYKHNIKPLGLLLFQTRFFFIFSLNKSIKHVTHRTGLFLPQGHTLNLSDNGELTLCKLETP